MYRLNVTDLIDPAWKRTRDFVIAPRNLRFALKICTVAFFAQIGGYNGSFGNMNGAGSSANHPLSPAIISLLIGVGLLLFLFGLVMFYVSSRLQLVLFHVVLLHSVTIRPIWRHAGLSTWSWIRLKLLTYLCVLVCFLLVGVPVSVMLVQALKRGAGTGAFVASIFAFIGAMFLLLAALLTVLVLLNDFALPSIALEQTALKETVKRVASLFRGEPLRIFSYILLRLLATAVAVLAAEAAIVIAALILALPLGGLSLMLWLALRHTGGAANVIMLGGWSLLGAIFVIFTVLAAILALGTAYIFVQNLAIMFLAQRYPLLDGLLRYGPANQEAYVFTPPPSGPPSDNNSGDPPLPMDPALA